MNIRLKYLIATAFIIIIMLIGTYLIVKTGADPNKYVWLVGMIAAIIFLLIIHDYD